MDELSPVHNREVIEATYQLETHTVRCEVCVRGENVCVERGENVCMREERMCVREKLRERERN